MIHYANSCFHEYLVTHISPNNWSDATHASVAVNELNARLPLWKLKLEIPVCAWKVDFFAVQRFTFYFSESLFLSLSLSFSVRDCCSAVFRKILSKRGRARIFSMKRKERERERENIFAIFSDDKRRERSRVWSSMDEREKEERTIQTVLKSDRVNISI